MTLKTKKDACTMILVPFL